MRSIHIDHGNPMNAILDNPFTQTMKQIGKEIKTPKNIIIISAHWLTEGEKIEISTHPHPPMIYDMYGFPPELYRVSYSVNTDIEWARELSGILEKNSIQNILNPNRGIDHGVWSVLMHLFPEANIPIIQVSVWYDKNAEFHYTLGKILSENFDDDTLFISSGNIVHNLRLLDWSGKSTPQWASDFDISIDGIIRSGEYKKITQYKNLPGSYESVPTPDHFYPFLTFLGSSKGKSIESAYHGFELGSISTRIYKNF